MKRIINCLLFLLPFYGLVASAQAPTPTAVGQSVLTNAPLPAPQHISGDTGYSLYYAATDTAGGNLSSSIDAQGNSFPEFYDANDGYRLIDLTDPNALIYIDVSINTPIATSGNQVPVVTIGTGTAVGDEIILWGASVVDQTSPNQAPSLCSNGPSNCIQGTQNSQLQYLSAIYSPGSTMRLSFRVADLCAAQNVQTGTTSICASANVINTVGFDGTAVFSQSITVSFSWADTTGASGAQAEIGSLVSGTQGAVVQTINIVLTDVAPTITRPAASSPIETFYAPGDGSIIFTADNYAPNTGVLGNGAPLANLVVIADRNQLPTISSNARPEPPTFDVSTTINPAGSNLIAPGFVNSTCTGTGATCTNGYNAAIYSLNTAGIFSLGLGITTPFTTGQGTISSDGLLHAEQVNSVLTKSKCFIATAAFHDGDAAPVVMLRKFRDKILAKSNLGQDFIRQYYTYSPPLARWAWDKPLIRSIALHALAPVEFMAWAILKLTHADEVSSQPYIDRVKKKLNDDDAKTAGSSESYSESIKKTLPPEPDDTESYSEREKKRLNLKKDESSEDYSKKIKDDLPPEEDTGSTIAKVKEGRDKRPTPKMPPITTAFSAKFGLSPGVTVKNSEGAVNFQDMYGNGSSWQPDLVLHYERQFFHSENYGSFGLQADLGISYAEGYGQYQYGFGSTDSKLSKTKFSFLQVPITVGGIYRFNLFRLLRPYVGVGIGTMLYDEIRSDDNPDKHGETPIYEGEVGLALELNLFDKTTATDGFLSAGIQHSYIFMEYMKMNSFATSGVTFGRSGIYLGFLVEY